MKVDQATYGKYRLRAGKLGDKFVARAFHSSKSSVQGYVAEAEGKSNLEALEALKNLLQLRDETRREARRHIARLDFYVPLTDEFAEALQAVGPSSREWDMLGVHAAAEGKGLTPLEIARAGGYNTISNANALYGKLGRKLGDQLGITGPKSTIREADVHTGILATYEPDPQGGETMVWIMHPELSEAIASHRLSRKD